jgi:hypothetical protein
MIEMEITKSIPVFIETGQKKTIAGAIDWPGWCRIAKDQTFALERLLAYAERYSLVLKPASLDFQLPHNLEELVVEESVAGNATTDFGAPAIILDSDPLPVEKKEFQRWRRILKACWQAFDAACQCARGKELLKGPRGGGRDLEAIISHLLEGDRAYLGKAATSYQVDPGADPGEQIHELRRRMLGVLDRAETEGLPELGPRGGKIWPVRYFVRRIAWHTLDHTWEIEDRLS